MNKRQFLKLSLLLSQIQLVSCVSNKEIVIIGSGKKNDKWQLHAIDKNGITLYTKRLPSRAHHIAHHRTQNKSLIIARRPGFFARLFDSKTGETIKEITSPNGHHFLGHSCINNNLIFISCEDHNSLGKIAVYDSNLIFSHFIELENFGPHQLELINDNQIAVALGGLITKNRDIQNLENFKSELLIVDIDKKKVTNRFSIKNSNLSLRHLHIHQQRIVIAAQIPDRDYLFEDLNTPLVYELKDNQLMALNHPNWNLFKQYIASISFDNNQLVATSPKGHTLGIWELKNDQFKFSNQLKYTDISSVTQLQDSIFCATGLGKSLRFTSKLVQENKQDIHWDNHWSARFV